ncbi:3-methylfumaryl-CoA hydratase [Pseudomonas frederiksbergensis]|jgi:3-methylfumaryl-CoA hydratase|uniref:FAS1-like dehydratase domain-containing protein n=1 Tax=Pseudomonas TaxID=286 RepID=UPI00037C420A|nr:MULTISPECIES: MaoC family dehydratase N-terminal domain-containing protein [Pseudomonas]QDV94664.1 acyl-CoA dehydrogenase [Pseudomonas sp. ATCC 43928]
MSTIDLQHLRQWIGKTHVDRDVLSSRHARLMAATLGIPQSDLVSGHPLPPLWHWLYFLDGLAPEELGRDGHPARGGFLPPVPLPNRMWAGGQLEFKKALPLDGSVEKRSSIVSIEHKQGRSGELVFVTVLHEILHAGEVAISEHHDIVYKEATPVDSNKPFAAMPPATHSYEWLPTSTTLFRYSALTFNGHRIHYDADYCRDVEHYASQVIHGPLNATLLAGYAERIAGKPVKLFNYRGVRPALLGATLTLNAVYEGDNLLLWVSLPDGAVSMQARASF